MQNLNFDQIIDRYSKKAKQSGVELEIIMQKGESLSASYSGGKLDPFSSSQDQVVGFRIIKGDCESISYSESTEPQDLDLIFQEAVESVELFPKSYKPKLVEPENYQKMPFLYNDHLNDINVEDKVNKAKLIEPTAIAFDKKIKAVPYQTFANTESEFSVFNSKGVKASYKSNAMYSYAYALATENEDNQMAGEVIYSKDFATMDVEAMAKTAAKKALNKLGAVKPKTGQYPVVFTAEMTQSLLSLFESSFLADQVDKNLSLLKGKLGKKIASDIVEIWDDPFLEKGPASRPFDSEGKASEKTCVIKNGELQTYLTNSVYAEKMQLKNTANASRGAKSSLGIGFSNLYLKPSEKRSKPLTDEFPTIIQIETMQGLHSGFNSISGDFSLQSEGFLFENGKRTKSLKGFVVSGNILELMENIVAVGDELKYDYKPVVCPATLVDKLSIAGD